MISCFILVYLSFLRTTFSQCNGQKCSSGCKNCDCNTKSCSGSCFCPSIKIPGGLRLEETPQFVFMSFNGALSEKFYKQTLFLEKLILNKNISDRNGCRVRPSFYITNDESDYGIIKFVFSQFINISKISNY